MTASTITPTKPRAAKRKGSKDSRKITRVILPRSVITSAAQFASTDGAKMILQCIHIYYESKEDKTIVVSSDGHRLFRCKLPGRLVSETLLLVSDDRNFKSMAGKADRVLLQLDKREPYYVTRSTVSSVKGKSRSTKKIIFNQIDAQFLDADGQRVRTHAVMDRRDWGTFPNTDQLIPDSRGVKDEDVVYNASYLMDFAKVAKRFSEHGHIKQVLSSPNTPNLFECDVEDDIYGDLKFELLLMPIQQRS
tara:strand:+ start:110 stop:856 length:747 start_codon:yes stop_codon:yes gene_type:complete